MGTCGNCTSWQDGGTQPMYQADPDIAGIGNIMVYIVSAFLGLCLSAAHLIFTISHPQNTSRIDRLVSKAVERTKLAAFAENHRRFWVPIIQKLVLGLSDQQLLTGLAVLVASFWTHCSISVYHFALASDLAWFSANVHLTTLNILQGFFLENPVLRNWRVALMVALAILLLASTVMEGHEDWYDSWPYDAQCLFDDLVGNFGGRPLLWMCLDLVLICFYYPTSIMTLYEGPRKSLDLWLEQKPKAARDGAIQSLEDKKSQSISRKFLEGSSKRFSFTLLIICVRTFGGMYFALKRALEEIFVSLACNLALDIAWFAFGLWSIVEDRKIPASQMNGNENAMTFGQIVPILLLSSIVLVFREAYDDQKKKAQEEQHSRSNPSELSLIRTRDSTTAASTPSLSIEMSGGLRNAEDEAEPEAYPPRRVDTESGGGSHTSAFEGQRLQRRPTHPSAEGPT